MTYLLKATAIAGVAMLCAGQASAHAFLQSATPAVGSTVASAPSQVVIGFTEGVEPRFSSIAVQDASGAAVQTGSVHQAGDDTHLAIGLKALPPGAYKVIWHATSTDTHKTQGSFTFTVAR